jgi:hypothetical protein
MDEHQAIFAEMCDNGTARPFAVLLCVTVFEVVLLIGKFEFHLTFAYGDCRILAFFESGEVT